MLLGDAVKADAIRHIHVLIFFGLLLGGRPQPSLSFASYVPILLVMAIILPFLGRHIENSKSTMCAGAARPVSPVVEPTFCTRPLAYTRLKKKLGPTTRLSPKNGLCRDGTFWPHSLSQDSIRSSWNDSQRSVDGMVLAAVVGQVRRAVGFRYFSQFRATRQPEQNNHFGQLSYPPTVLQNSRYHSLCGGRCGCRLGALTCGSPHAGNTSEMVEKRNELLSTRTRMGGRGP